MQKLDFDQILAKLDMPYNLLNEIVSRQDQNAVISNYYLERYYDSIDSSGYKDTSFLVTSNNVKQCFKSSQTNRHDNMRLLDVKNIYVCKNKFCSNCQKMLQATRLRRMFDVITSTETNSELYHIVLTVPNVKDYKLDFTIDTILEALTKLVRYFKLNIKIKGVDFSQYGYLAAFRALEITYNMTDKTYHPHLHCVFALRKNLNFKKQYINKFSLGKKCKTYFSDFEIFIQKLWRLLVDNITARKHEQAVFDNSKQKKEREQAKFIFDYNNTHIHKISEPIGDVDLANENALAFVGKDKQSLIAELFKPKKKEITAKRIIKRELDKMGIDDGYSCIVDLVDQNNIFEVFKYAFKTTDDDGQMMSYDVFKVLDTVLKGRRMVQGYGEWYGIQLDEIDTDSVDALYYYIESVLENDENKVECNYSAEELLEYSQDKKYTIISRKQLFQFVKDLDEYELKRYINNFDDLLSAVRENRVERLLERQNMNLHKTRNSIPTVESFNKAKENRKKIMEEKAAFARLCEQQETARQIEEREKARYAPEKYKQESIILVSDNTSNEAF